MTGTIRTMGQVGATLAYLVLLHGALVFRITGSHEVMVAEMFTMSQMCLAVALRTGIRFAER